MFYAENFIFNGIPSEFYNLHIGEIDASGVSTSPAGSDVQLLTQKIFRRPTPLFWGAEQLPVLQFPLSLYSPTEIKAETFSEISAWLFGQMSYKVLRICQNDMVDIYFNAFLTNPQVIKIGNIIKGLACTVICDSPWGWREPKTYTDSYPGSYNINDTVYILNESANNYYTYPSSFIVTANSYGGLITITNVTDSSRAFVYTAIAYETITMDCYNQSITSDSRQYPLNYFTGKNWFRLMRGFNTVTVSGSVASFSLTSEIAVKTGA